MRVTERMITQSLKARHDKRGDYFGSQIKMGRAGSKIIDGIAIPITWSPRTVIGYEIKCSRSDFLNDHKYPHYMTTCNEFYFVVPKGVIKKNEIPPEVGVVEFNPKNNSLRTLKKASYRNVDIDVDTLLHCIFYKIHQYNKPKTRVEILEEIEANKKLHEYGEKASCVISDLRHELEREQYRNDRKNETINEILSEIHNKTGVRPAGLRGIIKFIPEDANQIKKIKDAEYHLRQAYRILELDKE